VQRLTGLQSRPATANSTDESDESFRLVSIVATRTPSGCAGKDWLEYRITQGHNLITGYRRGDLGSATAAIEQIVIGLNERRVWAKSRTRPRPGRPPAAAARPANPDSSPDQDL
jgi:hypothetical protein